MGYDTRVYVLYRMINSSCCAQRERIHGEFRLGIKRTSRGFDVLKEGFLMIEIEKPKIETVEINDDAKLR